MPSANDMLDAIKAGDLYKVLEGTEYQLPSFMALKRHNLNAARVQALLAVLDECEKALKSADYAIKGREHTGFIAKALATINKTKQTVG